jgi:integrase/recombinase XerD
LLRFKEKGGKEKELPVHHKLEQLLDQYLKTTGLEKEPQSPLFPASIGKTGKLSRRPLVRTDAADMLKRRSRQSGCEIAGHADSRTTKLYDRRGQKVLLEDTDSILTNKPMSSLE